MKRAVVPNVAPQAANVYAVLGALKENVEVMSGLRNGQIQPLPDTATLSDVIAKVNELIDRAMNR